jgi:hypothetical protein
MWKQTWIVAAAVGMIASMPSAAWTQMSSTSSGTFGSRSIGQPMGGATSNAFGSQGFGSGSGLGSSSGFGSNSSYGSGSGASYGSGSSYGSQSSTGNPSRVIAIGQIPQTPNMRASSRKAGDFVGGDSKDVRTGMLGASASTSSSSSYSNNTNNTSRSNSRSGTGYGGNSSNTTTGGQMLVGLTLGVPARPTIVAPHMAIAVTARLAKSMRLPAGSPVTVAMTGRTAVLRGVVATEHDRALAEQLLHLEPGISEVANELRVDPSSGTTVGPPQTPVSQYQPASPASTVQ